MGAQSKPRVLFAGYAPVHFLCFKPVYDDLRRGGEVDLFLTGGFRKADGENATYELDGFYEGLSVDPAHVTPLDRATREEFDVLVCAHLSDDLFPRSYDKSVQIFHGVSFKNLAVREKALRFDFLCLPGRYHAQLYQRHGLVRPGGSKCLITGFPKSDAIVQAAGSREQRLHECGFAEPRPTVLFAPTGEKHNALDTLGREIVAAIAEDGRFNLMVKPHDHPKNPVDWSTELAGAEGPRVRVARDRDIVPYMQAADLLLTDASSVAVEYTLLDRPLVFIDVPKLFKKIRSRAPALDLETYGRKIGDIATDVSELTDVIARALERPATHSGLRRELAAHVFHAPGKAARHVAGVVQYAAGLRQQLGSGVIEVEPAVTAGTTGQPAGAPSQEK